MSRSQTYRRTQLTGAVRQELAVFCREQRHRQDVMPALREYVAQMVQARSSLTAQRRMALQHTIATAATPDALRRLTTEFTRETPPDRRTTSGSQLTPPGPSIDRESLTAVGHRRVEGGERRPDVDLDLDRVAARAEFDSVARAASEVGVDASELVAARAGLEEARRLAAAGRGAAARAALHRTKTSIDTVERRVLDALAAAECRTRTVDAVLGALAEMGYRAEVTAVREGETRIVAQAADGRHAEVGITGTGDPAKVDATFADPSDAVAPTNPHAGQICEPAVTDSYRFHRTVGATAGLDAGRPDAAHPPTRDAIPHEGHRPRHSPAPPRARKVR